MFLGNGYLYGWLFYLLGATVLVGVWWFLTRKIRVLELRYLLRVLVATSLLVPWYSTENAVYLSPAWLMAVFEGIFEGQFWRAGLPLISVLGAVTALSLLYWLARWAVLRRVSASSPSSE